MPGLTMIVGAAADVQRRRDVDRGHVRPASSRRAPSVPTVSRSCIGVAVRVDRASSGCGSGRSSRAGSRARAARASCRPAAGSTARRRRRCVGGFGQHVRRLTSVGEIELRRRSGCRSRAGSRRTRARGRLQVLVALAALRCVLGTSCCVPLAFDDAERLAGRRVLRRRSTRTRRRTSRRPGAGADAHDEARLDAHVVARELFPQLRADRELPVVHVGRVDLSCPAAGRSSAASSRRRTTARTAACTRNRVGAICVQPASRHSPVSASVCGHVRIGVDADVADRRVSVVASAIGLSLESPHATSSDAPSRLQSTAWSGIVLRTTRNRGPSSAGADHHGLRDSIERLLERPHDFLLRRRRSPLMWQPPAPG